MAFYSLGRASEDLLSQLQMSEAPGGSDPEMTGEPTELGELQKELQRLSMELGAMKLQRLGEAKGTQAAPAVLEKGVQVASGVQLFGAEGAAECDREAEANRSVVSQWCDALSRKLIIIIRHATSFSLVLHLSKESSLGRLGFWEALLEAKSSCAGGPRGGEGHDQALAGGGGVHLEPDDQ